MNNLTAIILTKDEQLHIRRCLENISPICDKIFVIDCFSTDDTVKICRCFTNVEVIQREWPGLYAKQLNWAIDNCKIETDWVLRIDADEYFMPGEREKLMQLLPSIKKGQNALSLARARYFLGRHIKHGGTGNVKMIRVFRNGIGRCEERNMDEHIVISEGEVVETNIVFADDNRNDLAWWTCKHLGYAKREAADLLDIVNEVDGSAVTIGMNNEAAMKRRTKLKYARLPLFWRAFAYFCYRYFIRLGFLDGKEGFLWHFLQGWWYRVMVDSLLYRKIDHSTNIH